MAPRVLAPHVRRMLREFYLVGEYLQSIGYRLELRRLGARYAVLRECDGFSVGEVPDLSRAVSAAREDFRRHFIGMED